ncbi:hypothetical protein H6F87_23695 [Cyanobacteria bacterium FACHB-502]|jgi:hypothetical protein|nr:hypothetical protein [Cyanobacteria bacterium FACHB-502]
MKLNARRYIDQVDDLLWTGRLQGNAIWDLYQLVHAYLGVKVTGEALQEAIDLSDWH